MANDTFFFIFTKIIKFNSKLFKHLNCNHKFKYTTYMYIRYMLFYIKWGIIMEVIVEYPGTLNRELVQLASKITTKITIVNILSWYSKQGTS